MGRPSANLHGAALSAVSFSRNDNSKPKEGDYMKKGLTLGELIRVARMNWWPNREKKTAAIRKALVESAAKKQAKPSQGKSKAAKEQKRQKRARMIQRRSA